MNGLADVLNSAGQYDTTGEDTPCRSSPQMHRRLVSLWERGYGEDLSQKHPGTISSCSPVNLESTAPLGARGNTASGIEDVSTFDVQLGYSGGTGEGLQHDSKEESRVDEPLRQQRQILSTQESTFSRLGEPISALGSCVSLSKWGSGSPSSPTIEESWNTSASFSTNRTAVLPEGAVDPVKVSSKIPPRTGAAVVAESRRGLGVSFRGKLERLLRFSNWQSQDRPSEVYSPPSAPRRSATSWDPVERHRNGLDNCGLSAEQQLVPCDQHVIQARDTPSFAAAHPDVHAQVMLLMEIQRMRSDLVQMHMQQQCQPSIVIQNNSAVTATAEAPTAAPPPTEKSWILEWLTGIFDSRINRLLLLSGVGVSCYMLLEHWRHSWRMAQLRRRMDANLLMRSFQMIEDSLGRRRV